MNLTQFALERRTLFHFITALLLLGVRNYVGPLGDIPDQDALTFALRFYERALSREPLGRAVRIGGVRAPPLGAHRVERRPRGRGQFGIVVQRCLEQHGKAGRIADAAQCGTRGEATRLGAFAGGFEYCFEDDRSFAIGHGFEDQHSRPNGLSREVSVE